MKITWGLENATHNPLTITTLGSYDGMHRGHIEILKHLLIKQEELALERSMVITFDPHPQEVLRKNDSSVGLLTTIDERLDLLEKSGVDETLVIWFSLEFAKTPYQEFFRSIIIQQLGTKSMVVGFNHAFGKNREGDIEHLRILARDAGITIDEVPPLIIDGESVSSTKIRHALLEGNIERANVFLGRTYEVNGVVEHGDKLGRKLGFATANLRVPENKLLPCDGVYSGKALYQNAWYPTAISIGSRPTIESDGKRVVEAFILDFDNDIYGEKVTLRFHEYIRKQEKFDSLEALSHQIEADIQKVRVGTRD